MFKKKATSKVIRRSFPEKKVVFEKPEKHEKAPDMRKRENERPRDLYAKTKHRVT